MSNNHDEETSQDLVAPLEQQTLLFYGKSIVKETLRVGLKVWKL